MVIKITCKCGASFEITHQEQHPRMITCPNCGTRLSEKLSEDLPFITKLFDECKAELQELSNDYQISVYDPDSTL